MSDGGSKRFGVLLCAADSEYVKDKYGGYFGIFKAMLGEDDGETWDEFRAFAGEIPGDGEIGLYDGFVITGSCSDAHGHDGWIVDLLALIKKLDSMKKKVLGICFGHQLKELPPTVEVVARSDKTGIEMFKFEDHIMGIQGHPKYTKDILLHLIDRLLQKGLIVDSFADEMKVKVSGGACEPDKKAWRKLCINFLKNSSL